MTILAVSFLPQLAAGKSATQDDVFAGELEGHESAFGHSERSASTAFTLAARAAGRADAITAAARITKADATKAICSQD
jgi:hypothetical protein